MSDQVLSRKSQADIVVDHALRWCSNILVEVLSNHGEHIHPESRTALREITSLLSRLQSEHPNKADGT